MKVAIVGTHGIPARYGGFETFAEEISRLLVNEGYEVAVQCDISEDRPGFYHGVELFYSKVTKSNHPLIFYYSGLKHSLNNSDIIIIAGTGGAPFYFLNLFKRRILITNTDGIEYNRSKWSFFHRLYLRFTEMLSIRYSDVAVADSESIKQYLEAKYRPVSGKIRVIEYGSELNQNFDITHLDSYKLTFRGYYLVVSRLEPENNLVMIIEGYLKSGTLLPLVIVGNVTSTGFVSDIVRKYSSEKVIFAGGIYERGLLNSLRYSCRAYLHGHSVGGTNPSLLEAMGNGNVIISHDNVFNREVTADNQFYFSDSDSCSAAIKAVEQLNDQEFEDYRSKAYNRIRDYYNWENIVEKYISLFHSMRSGKSSV